MAPLLMSLMLFLIYPGGRGKSDPRNLNFKAFMAFKCFNTLLVFVMTHNINKNC